MLNYKLYTQGGFTPADVAPPMRQPPNRCYVIIARRRGGMGGQALSPPSSYQHLEFHINVKGILQCQLPFKKGFSRVFFYERNFFPFLYAGEEI
jgi:hypothetical protein